MIENEIKVSICMITYNHELFLKEAIESVLNQQVDFKIEFIIADDNSPDKTSDIVDSFTNHTNFSWIKYIKHSKNLGMMGNSIFALKRCTGKYIALCEGDDFWTDPLKLQKQVDFLEANDDYVSICSEVAVLDEIKNKQFLMKSEFGGKILYENVFSGIFFPTCTILYRNISDINLEWANTSQIGDLALLFELAKTKKNFYFLNYPTATYRIHEGGSFGHQAPILQLKKIEFFLGLSLLHYKEKEIVSLIKKRLLKTIYSIFLFGVYNNRDLEIEYKHKIKEFGIKMNYLYQIKILLLNVKAYKKHKKKLLA